MDKVILGMTYSGCNSARLASRCLQWPLTGPGNPGETSLGNFGPLRLWPGQSAVSWDISRPFWCWVDHLRSVWIWTCLFQNPILFCKYFSPLISHRKGSVFRINILSKPQLNPNSTQPNITLSWLRHENDFAYDTLQDWELILLPMR